MNELSLFSGAGGGLLGTMLLGFRPIGYVEWDDFCQRVIAARIRDGILPDAPIFGDIRTFIDQGYAASYQGLVDVITGGFPCQDISCAGRGKGIEGERSGLWKAMADTIRIVRPRYVLVENSPMLTIRGLGTVLRDLAKMGFNARWGVFSAADCGAYHKRERVFLLAYTDEKRLQEDRIQAAKFETAIGLLHTPSSEMVRYSECGTFKGRIPWPSDESLWRVANDEPHRVDRLKALGNGQVPQVVRTAWKLLTGRAQWKP